MANPIKLPRGIKANVGNLENGAIVWTTDSNEIIIGTGVGNVVFSPQGGGSGSTATIHYCNLHPEIVYDEASEHWLIVGYPILPGIYDGTAAPTPTELEGIKTFTRSTDILQVQFSLDLLMALLNNTTISDAHYQLISSPMLSTMPGASAPIIVVQYNFSAGYVQLGAVTLNEEPDSMTAEFYKILFQHIIPCIRAVNLGATAIGTPTPLFPAAFPNGM
jgi:hypothetical protein